jgi:hypothetical protein
MIPSMGNQPDHHKKYNFTGEYRKLWIRIKFGPTVLQQTKMIRFLCCADKEMEFLFNVPYKSVSSRKLRKEHYIELFSTLWNFSILVFLTI